MKQNCHININLRGSKKKRVLFNLILGQRDHDWPLYKYTNPPVCDYCKGILYTTPLFSMQQVKALARQLNKDSTIEGHLKLKVHSWITTKKCLDKYVIE